MTTENKRRLEEEQIKNNFSELQKRLEDLKSEVQSETDESKKQEKNNEIQKLEKELSEIKTFIDTLSELQEQDLESLKTKLESIKNTYKEYGRETVDLKNEKFSTPKTYELLKGSETSNRLLNIIESNPDNFKDLPGDTAEKKLEYIFEKIRGEIVQFLKNKLGKSENCEKIINNTIAPAFERNLMELLREQRNETNIHMLEGMNGISWDSLGNLFDGVRTFANKYSDSYAKFSQWINAIDYLSVHNGVLRNSAKSEVLTNPLKFQEYMNNTKFSEEGFSPYTSIHDNIFEINENQNFEFGISLQEKQSILDRIGHIQVVNNPQTTSLIVKMLDKTEQFLQQTEGLQQAANGLLDGVDSLNSVTKIFGVDIDILGEFTKDPEERGLLYKILDFICKLIGITGGLEGIVKKWRLDKMNLTDEKNENIGKIFKEYKELAGENTSLSIIDENSCKAALEDFAITDSNTPTKKGDFLCNSITENMNVSLISPAVVQIAIDGHFLGNNLNYYLKKETIQENGKNKERYVVDDEKFTEDDKQKLARAHLISMKSHLEKYKDLSDFYKNIQSTEDIALCIIASLYADKNDVIEGVKAKVFLPENYGSIRLDGTVVDTGNIGGNSLSELTSDEKSAMQTLVEQSKTPNSIRYLENPTYKKYLNIIERDLKLPKYSLESVCKQESQGRLYSGNNILGSSAGARGLFQFMPGTADTYMKHSQLAEKYGKTFASRDEFLKDPLASAWAAGIMYSEFMHKYNYNFQSSLACYNRGIGNYKKHFGNKNLTSGDLNKLPNETKGYVEKISKDVLEHNSDSSSDVLLADLGKYIRNNGGQDKLEHNNELLIGPKLLAHNKNEIGGLGNSIMNGFQGLNAKTNFPEMNGNEGKSTLTHPNRFSSQNDVLAYKNTHPNIKSFMFYFGANTRDNSQTYSDIKQWSEWLQYEGIQPVLCTCIGEDKQTWLAELNQKIISLGKEKTRPVIDFAKSYKKGDIKISPDGVHPSSYTEMTNIINEQLNQA